jgi:hypothetical protein
MQLHYRPSYGSALEFKPAIAQNCHWGSRLVLYGMHSAATKGTRHRRHCCNNLCIRHPKCKHLMSSSHCSQYSRTYTLLISHRRLSLGVSAIPDYADLASAASRSCIRPSCCCRAATTAAISCCACSSSETRVLSADTSLVASAAAATAATATATAMVQ